MFLRQTDLPASIRVLCWWPQGVARIPEDRHAVGVVGDLPVWENAVLRALLRQPEPSRAATGIAPARSGDAPMHSASLVQRIRCPGCRRRGTGDDHGLAVGRQHAEAHPRPCLVWRSRTPRRDKPVTPRLIVAHQPTWGLDIGAVAYVQEQLIDGLRDAGSAAVLADQRTTSTRCFAYWVTSMAVIHARPPRCAPPPGCRLVAARRSAWPWPALRRRAHAGWRNATRPVRALAAGTGAPVGAVAGHDAGQRLVAGRCGRAPRWRRPMHCCSQGGFGSVFRAGARRFTRAIPLMLTGLAATVAFQRAPVQHRWQKASCMPVHWRPSRSVACTAAPASTRSSVPLAAVAADDAGRDALAGALLLLGPALAEGTAGGGRGGDHAAAQLRRAAGGVDDARRPDEGPQPADGMAPERRADGGFVAVRPSSIERRRGCTPACCGRLAAWHWRVWRC